MPVFTDIKKVLNLEKEDNDNKTMVTGKLLSAAAFESAFRRLYTPLFYYSYDILSDEELSKDIVSEIFAKLWKSHRDLQEEGLKNYLYACVRNRSLDEMRRQGRMPEVPIDLATEVGEDDDSWKEREQQIVKLNNAVSKLSTRSQKILDMRYRLHLPIADIALQEGMSESGVKKSLYRSLCMLRELMNAKNLQNIVHLLLLV